MAIAIMRFMRVLAETMEKRCIVCGYFGYTIEELEGVFAPFATRRTFAMQDLLPSRSYAESLWCMGYRIVDGMVSVTSDRQERSERMKVFKKAAEVTHRDPVFRKVVASTNGEKFASNVFMEQDPLLVTVRTADKQSLTDAWPLTSVVGEPPASVRDRKETVLSCTSKTFNPAFFLSTVRPNLTLDELRRSRDYLRVEGSKRGSDLLRLMYRNIGYVLTIEQKLVGVVGGHDESVKAPLEVARVRVDSAWKMAVRTLRDPTIDRDGLRRDVRVVKTVRRYPQIVELPHLLRDAIGRAFGGVDMTHGVTEGEARHILAHSADVVRVYADAQQLSGTLNGRDELEEILVCFFARVEDIITEFRAKLLQLAECKFTNMDVVKETIRLLQETQPTFDVIDTILCRAVWTLKRELEAVWKKQSTEELTQLNCDDLKSMYLYGTALEEHFGDADAFPFGLLTKGTASASDDASDLARSAVKADKLDNFGLGAKSGKRASREHKMRIRAKRGHRRKATLFNEAGELQVVVGETASLSVSERVERVLRSREEGLHEMTQLFKQYLVPIMYMLEEYRGSSSGGDGTDASYASAAGESEDDAGGSHQPSLVGRPNGGGDGDGGRAAPSRAECQNQLIGVLRRVGSASPNKSDVQIVISKRIEDILAKTAVGTTGRVGAEDIVMRMLSVFVLMMNVWTYLPLHFLSSGMRRGMAGGTKLMNRTTSDGDESDSITSSGAGRLVSVDGDALDHHGREHGTDVSGLRRDRGRGTLSTMSRRQFDSFGGVTTPSRSHFTMGGVGSGGGGGGGVTGVGGGLSGAKAGNVKHIDGAPVAFPGMTVLVSGARHTSGGGSEKMELHVGGLGAWTGTGRYLGTAPTQPSAAMTTGIFLPEAGSAASDSRFGGRGSGGSSRDDRMMAPGANAVAFPLTDQVVWSSAGGNATHENADGATSSADKEIAQLVGQWKGVRSNFGATGPSGASGGMGGVIVSGSGAGGSNPTNPVASTIGAGMGSVDYGGDVNTGTDMGGSGFTSRRRPGTGSRIRNATMDGRNGILGILQRDSSRSSYLRSRGSGRGDGRDSPGASDAGSNFSSEAGLGDEGMVVPTGMSIASLRARCPLSLRVLTSCVQSLATLHVPLERRISLFFKHTRRWYRPLVRQFVCRYCTVWADDVARATRLNHLSDVIRGLFEQYAPLLSADRVHVDCSVLVSDDNEVASASFSSDSSRMERTPDDVSHAVLSSTRNLMYGFEGSGHDSSGMERREQQSRTQSGPILLLNVATRRIFLGRLVDSVLVHRCVSLVWDNDWKIAPWLTSTNPVLALQIVVNHHLQYMRRFESLMEKCELVWIINMVGSSYMALLDVLSFVHDIAVRVASNVSTTADAFDQLYFRKFEEAHSPLAVLIIVHGCVAGLCGTYLPSMKRWMRGRSKALRACVKDMLLRVRRVARVLRARLIVSITNVSTFVLRRCLLGGAMGVSRRIMGSDIEACPHMTGLLLTNQAHDAEGAAADAQMARQVGALSLLNVDELLPRPLLGSCHVYGHDMNRLLSGIPLGKRNYRGRNDGGKAVAKRIELIMSHDNIRPFVRQLLSSLRRITLLLRTGLSVTSRTHVMTTPRDVCTILCQLHGRVCTMWVDMCYGACDRLMSFVGTPALPPGLGGTAPYAPCLGSFGPRALTLCVMWLETEVLRQVCEPLAVSAVSKQLFRLMTYLGDLVYEFLSPSLDASVGQRGDGRLEVMQAVATTLADAAELFVSTSQADVTAALSVLSSVPGASEVATV